MKSDVLDLYGRASEWTLSKVAGAKELNGTTPCDEWDVRTLMNHMLDTQGYFVSVARDMTHRLHRRTRPSSSAAILWPISSMPAPRP